LSDLERERKLALNEVMFRDVNENIEKTAVDNRYQAGDLPSFVCECSDPDCGELIRLALPQYEEVRNYPSRFLVRPGHEVREIENPVERHKNYLVIEKIGEGRATAEEADRRPGPEPGLPPS